MTIRLKDMNEEPPTNRLKIAIVGREKHGKSWLAATGRPIVLVHDFDNRAEALAGKKGVFTISYEENQWPKQPEAAQLFLDILSKLEETLDIHDIANMLRVKNPRIPQVPKGTIVGTNVIDSVQTFGAAFQKYALYGQKDIRRTIKFGGYEVHLPGGWDAWNAEMRPVEDAILRVLALPCDTIINLHETEEETADSTSEKPRFTGKIGVFPVRYQRLIKYVNELWRVKLTQVTSNNKLVYIPRVYPTPTYEFDAATAMLLDPVEDPDICRMIAKHESRQKLLSDSSKNKPQLVSSTTKL